MNGLALPLALLLLVLGVGSYFLFRSQAIGPTATVAPEGAAGQGGGSAAPMKADPSATQGGAAAAGQKPDPKPEAAPVPTTPLAKTLGWSDADAEALRRWYAAASTTQNQFFNELEDGAGEDGGKNFNEATDKLRGELVQRYGLERANQALREFPIYRFDMRGGFVIQVDAQGQRLPFKDPKMANAWSNFAKQ